MGSSPAKERDLEMRLGGIGSTLCGVLIPSLAASLIPYNDPPTTTNYPLWFLSPKHWGKAIPTQGMAPVPSPALEAGYTEMTMHPVNPGGTLPHRGVIVMKAREDGSDKKKQLMIMPSKGSEGGSQRRLQGQGLNGQGLQICRQQSPKGPSARVLAHSIYLSNTYYGSGHPGAGATVVNKAAPVRADLPGGTADTGSRAHPWWGQ